LLGILRRRLPSTPRVKRPVPAEQQIRVGRVDVRYRVAGAGEPLLLVHGLSGSWRWWRDSLPALAEHRRVVLVDLPGFGGMRGQRFGLPQAPALLGSLAESLELPERSVDLVGHSLGGLVCARLAAERPDLVRRLVLVAPAGALPSAALRAHVLPLAATLARSGPRLVRLAALDAARAGPATLWRAARQLLSYDVRADLASVRAPTLLLWGERDGLVPPSLGEAFRAMLPDARLQLLAGAGHNPMVERPDAFARAVLDFLDGARA
jgi:pimeloyl-ACP methyl ester carboxylesterase